MRRVRWSRYPGTARRGDRYGLLLLLLVSNYLFSAFTTGRYANAVESAVFALVLALALRTSGVSGRVARVILVAVATGSGAAIALLVGQAADVGLAIASLLTGLVLLVTVTVIVRRVLTMPSVTLQSILGALSAYLIVGLMFAAFYAAMGHLQAAPFFVNGQPANNKTYQYFSFTTLATLGYGDFTAASDGGRAVAVMEAVAGQVFLVTLVARLVSAYRGPRSQAPDQRQREPGQHAERDGPDAADQPR